MDDLEDMDGVEEVDVEDCIPVLRPQMDKWGHALCKAVFTKENMQKVKEFKEDEGHVFKRYDTNKIHEAVVVEVDRLQEVLEKCKAMVIEEISHIPEAAQDPKMSKLMNFNTALGAQKDSNEMEIMYFSYHAADGIAGEGKLAWHKLPKKGKAAVLVNVATCEFELEQSWMGKKWRWLTGDTKAMPQDVKNMILLRTRMEMLVDMQEIELISCPEIPKSMMDLLED